MSFDFAVEVGHLRSPMIANRTPHGVQQLVDELESFGEYPAKVRRISASARIQRTAFFPAGFGLWDPDGTRPALPPRPVVVFGNNWGKPVDFEEARREGIEYSESWSDGRRRSCPTWFNLLAMLRGAGVGPERCFFGNVYMGLKDDGKGNVGVLDVTPEFEERCRRFLVFQLRVLAPSIVVAMGGEAIAMLAKVLPLLANGVWLGARGGARRVRDEPRVVEGVRVDDGGPVFRCVKICHACDGRNLSEGLELEIALLRRAVDGVAADA